jgi:hypothetical protein
MAADTQLLAADTQPRVAADIPLQAVAIRGRAAEDRMAAGDHTVAEDIIRI